MTRTRPLSRRTVLAGSVLGGLAASSVLGGLAAAVAGDVISVSSGGVALAGIAAGAFGLPCHC